MKDMGNLVWLGLGFGLGVFFVGFLARLWVQMTITELRAKLRTIQAKLGELDKD